jgi:hypothetical protein
VQCIENRENMQGSWSILKEKIAINEKGKLKLGEDDQGSRWKI